MRIPIPTNRLVAFTLAGAVLTMVVAGGLAVPGLLGQESSSTDTAPGTTSTASPQVADDAPTPNRNFTPAVQTQSGGEYEEHGEGEEEEREDEEHGEGEEEEREDEEHDREDEEE
ncbi:MAG: hypothetical protein ABEJ73_08025 [Haloplanus sp.]